MTLLLMCATALLQISGHIHWYWHVTNSYSCDPTRALYRIEFPLMAMVIMTISSIGLHTKPIPDKETRNVRCLGIVRCMCTFTILSLPLGFSDMHLVRFVGIYEGPVADSKHHQSHSLLLFPLSLEVLIMKQMTRDEALRVLFRI